MLRAVWPDGRDVVADPAGTAVPRDTAEQVVSSVAPATAADLTALWTAANDRVSALPLVTEISLPSGTLELRGEALCLRLEAATSCQPASPSGVGVAIDGEVSGSFQVDGTWYEQVRELRGRAPLVPVGGVERRVGPSSVTRNAPRPSPRTSVRFVFHTPNDQPPEEDVPATPAGRALLAQAMPVASKSHEVSALRRRSSQSGGAARRRVS